MAAQVVSNSTVVSGGSWLDHVSLSFLEPYNQMALAKYRELHKLAPANVQGPLNTAEEYYHWAMSKQDPRTKDWPLMNPFHNLFLVISYLTIVFVLVQIAKRRTTPFPTKFLAMFHNLFCTLLSLYMCLEIWRQAYINDYSLFSNSIDRSSKGLPMASVLWVFYASKVPEFMDTFLMALKRNFRQITFLHVYHHSSIFIIWWFIMSYAPGGDSYFSAALNSFVHVVMYGYYFWASVAPKQDPTKKPRWNQPAFYKKYITSFQLLQFCMNFVQANIMLFVRPPADFPMWTVWILFVYMITMLVLFGNFYLQTYTSKKNAKIAGADGSQSKKKQ